MKPKKVLNLLPNGMKEAINRVFFFICRTIDMYIANFGQHKITFLKSNANDPVRLGFACSLEVVDGAVVGGAVLPGLGLTVVVLVPPTILTGMRTCVPSSVCACWKVRICCCCGCVEGPEVSLLLPAGDAMVAEPGTGPHVNSRRLALPALMLPGAGEPKRSAAVGECIGSEEECESGHRGKRIEPISIPRCLTKKFQFQAFLTFSGNNCRFFTRYPPQSWMHQRRGEELGWAVIVLFLVKLVRQRHIFTFGNDFPARLLDSFPYGRVRFPHITFQDRFFDLHSRTMIL